MSETIFDVELHDLGGIGLSTERKLKDAGIESVLDLAVALPEEVAEKIGCAKENANAMIFVAQKALMESGLIDKEFVLAIENYEKRKSMLRCTTGSKNLDDLLMGGIETQAITELWGDFGSGKSQICHTLCVTAQLPVKIGGFGGGVIFIDTENTFRPERVYQIAEARGLDPIEVLKKVVICRVYNSSHLELVVRRLGKYVEQYNAKLVIIDSIISLHRSEFAGRGTLVERQQRLNGLVHRLLRMAEIYNIAVVVTNQVQAQPDTFSGDPTKPAGGHVIGHACTYRVHLKKAGQERIATIVDSPYHPYSDTRFMISEKGVEDPEPKRAG